GRILRDAGRYQAAEVTYEGAAQAADHHEQREAAEREILVTRRYAFYAPRRPDEVTPAERWFAETGSVVLASDEGPEPPTDVALATALLELARDSGWRFGQVVAVGPPSDAWQTVADGLGVPLVGRTGFDSEACPLLVARGGGPLPEDHPWPPLVSAVIRRGPGLVFLLGHPAAPHPPSPWEAAAGMEAPRTPNRRGTPP